jgi:hypothetical protein
MTLQKCCFFARRFSFPIWTGVVLCSLGSNCLDGMGQEQPNLVSSAETKEVDSLPARLAPSPAEFAEWIEQLSSDEYRIREQAIDKLSRCESRYIGELRRLANEHADLEIRRRCDSVADAIYEVDVSDRARDFLQNSGPNNDGGFKGWKRFSEIVGDSRLMKRLFVDFAKKYPLFADSEMNDPKQVTPFLSRLSREIGYAFRQTRQVDLVDTVALQLCAVLLDGNVQAEIEGLTAILARSSPYSSALSQSPYKKGLRRLTGQWSNVSLRVPEHAMQLALEKEIKESLPVAVRSLQTPDIGPVTFELACAMFARYGTKEDLPLIAKWCQDERLHSHQEDQRLIPMKNREQKADDETPAPPAFPMYTFSRVEVRYQDIAIATYLMIADRDAIEDYLPRIRFHPFRGFMISSLGYSEEETKDRESLVEAWKTLYAKSFQEKQP